MADHDPSPRADADAAHVARDCPRQRFGLRPRLAALCVVLVLLAEIMVFIPSAANFRRAWLEERVDRAQTASLAVEASPSFEISEDLSRELLANAEVLAVALKRDGQRQLILAGVPSDLQVVTLDLREEGPVAGIGATLATPFQPPRLLRVLDEPRLAGGEFIEVLVPEAPLRADLAAFCGRVAILSLIIAAVVAGGFYFLLNRFLVRPIRRLAGDMARFRADPHQPSLDHDPSGRADELGLAEEEFALLRDQLREALRARERLAGLGEAVAKINHDLRNILTSAHLVSDRLRLHADPAVASRAERLVRSIDRGVRLAEDVLRYGRADEGAPQPAPVTVRPVIEEAFADASAVASMPTGLEIIEATPTHARVDPDHLHRIVLNLMRNAVQAMATNAGARGRPGMLRVHVSSDADAVQLRLADEGPGMPQGIAAQLFQPFQARGREGGSGLGLAIARQLARANGGNVRLETTGPDGTVFELTLPIASADKGHTGQG